MPPNPNLKAVFFDIGGVVVRSPLIAIAEYEQERGMPLNWINTLITRTGNQGAWQRFERGEVDLFPFYQQFGSDLSNIERGKVWYAEYCEKRGLPFPELPAAERLKVDGRELFGRMMHDSVPDPVIVRAIRQIRASGRFKLVAVTNNFARSHVGIPRSELDFLGWSDGSTAKGVKELFDDYVDSSVVGLRKPDPDMFILACKRNDVEPHEVVMIDDLGMNLKGAQSIGMHTILVPIGGSVQVVKQLGEILGLELLDESIKAKL